MIEKYKFVKTKFKVQNLLKKSKSFDYFTFWGKVQLLVTILEKVKKTRKTRSLAIAGVSPYQCTVLMSEKIYFLITKIT
jgi:hypothetical protein